MGILFGLFGNAAEVLGQWEPGHGLAAMVLGELLGEDAGPAVRYFEERIGKRTISKEAYPRRDKES